MKTVTVPGSKSYTHRALIISALTKGRVMIINSLASDDTDAMASCLKKLASGKKSVNLDVNLSGTAMKFILALSTITPGIKVIGGGTALNKRPIGPLVEALRQLGARIEYLSEEGYPPVRVLSSSLASGIVRISGRLSSQYISALLLIAPVVKGMTIRVSGEQISKPYIDMTIDIMKKFGVRVRNKNHKLYVVPPGQSYQTAKYVVEGDLSSASYFFAIAALTQTKIMVKNLNPRSVQADMRFLKILSAMKNKVTYGKQSITVSGVGVRPLAIDMSDCPDQVQTLAVLAAFANGTTTISGVQSLRIKETDRVAAVRTELKKMGIRTKSTRTTLKIYGGAPHSAIIETYGDHRMAMAFAVAQAKLSGIEIRNPEVVSKTFPNFWKQL
jgi:3-phosphoshikimate 1-carboxyvinyltransferase